MDPPIYLSLISYFLVTFVCSTDAENRIQMFSIHREEDCSDSGEFYSKSERNLDRVSPLVSCGVMRCFCNHYGLWIFSTYKNFKPSRRDPIKAGVSHFELRGQTCESRKLNWRFLQLHSIRHVGHSDISVRSLSLYSNESFFGSELRLTGNSLSLPSPMGFSSVGFTGGRTWAIFPSPNFIGNFTCIGPPKRNSLIYNHPNISLTVGSIFAKCPKNTNFTIPKSVNYLILYKNAQDGDRNQNIGGNAEATNATLFLDCQEIQLPTPQIFVEFSIAGSEKWTIYAGLDFNGKSRCLTTFGQNQGRNDPLRRFRFRRSNTGISKEIGEDEHENPDFGETWLIGSIRRGCFLSSTTQSEEDYEDQLYDYYERIPPMESGDETSLPDWNTTNPNISIPVSTNGAEDFIVEGKQSRVSHLLLLSLWCFAFY